MFYNKKNPRQNDRKKQDINSQGNDLQDCEDNMKCTFTFIMFSLSGRIEHLTEDDAPAAATA